MRIRIALGTAVAVIAIPALLFALFSSTSAASARVTRHEAVSLHRTVKIDSKLMSYAQAERVAKLTTFYNAVEASQEATYLNTIAYFRQVAFLAALQKQKDAAAQAAAARAQAAAVVAPAPAPAPAGGVSDATSTNTPDWACIRQHESSGNYADGGGGAYQFGNGTWTSVTGLPGPAQSYPAATQDSAALRLFAERGWEPWTTRYVCGL